MKDAVQRVFQYTNDALSALGLRATTEVVNENLTGDEGMDGYVLLARQIAIYPQEVDGIRQGVGWGVSAETVIPGCHTMPNGDPGYPDDVDVIDLAPPYVESKSLVGSLRFPRTARDAVSCAIRSLIDSQLDEWLAYGDKDASDARTNTG